LAARRANDPIRSFDEVLQLQPSRVASAPPEFARELYEYRQDHLRREHSYRERARIATESAASERDLIERSWQLTLNRGTLRDVPEEFQLAVDIIESSRCEMSVRFNGALTILASTARRRPAVAEHADIVRDLIVISPIASIDDTLDELMRDPEFLRVARERLEARGKLPSNGSDK
jgi:hypothetical protein